VDFPAPLGPMKATRSPSSTVKVMPFTACVSRRTGRKRTRTLPRSPGCFSRVTKVLVSCCACMTVKGFFSSAPHLKIAVYLIHSLWAEEGVDMWCFYAYLYALFGTVK
jgi:hypothetical protein